MQLSHLRNTEVRELLEQGELHLSLEGPGSGRTLILSCAGVDMIAVTDGATGDAVVIAPDDPTDEASIHDQARRLQ